MADDGTMVDGTLKSGQRVDPLWIQNTRHRVAPGPAERGLTACSTAVTCPPACRRKILPGRTATLKFYEGGDILVTLVRRE